MIPIAAAAALIPAAGPCHRAEMVEKAGIDGGAVPVREPRITSCHDCPIRQSAVCADCDELALADLERMKSYRRFEAGQPVMWAGEPLSFVSTVVSGVAMLSLSLPDGRRQMVGLLLPSDLLGRPSREIVPYDVTAATDLTLCSFRRIDFARVVARTPRLGARIMEMTLDELDAAREWMLLLGRKSARERIASLLVIMARRVAALNRRPPHDGMQFPLHISREAMADYLGLTIETVSRQISALRRDRLVEMDGTRTVIVPDFGRLVEESGETAFHRVPA